MAALADVGKLGQAAGSAEWLEALEERTGRVLKAQKRGPKPNVVKCI
jgi:hypothetical protein